MGGASNFIVLDLQYFLDNNGDVIVKELASVSNDNRNLKIFKNPFPWSMLSPKRQKTNHWTTKNHHGIHWNYGNIPYSELLLILTSLTHTNDQVFTKGHEKKMFLERMLQRDVLDINEFIDPTDFKKEVYDQYINCNLS